MNFKSITVPTFALTLLCFTVQQQAGIFNNFINACKNISFAPLTQTTGSLSRQTTNLLAMSALKLRETYNNNSNFATLKQNINSLYRRAKGLFTMGNRNEQFIRPKFYLTENDEISAHPLLTTQELFTAQVISNKISSRKASKRIIQEKPVKE